MSVGAPKENTNACKWTKESAHELFDKAIALTEGDSKFDFIGEVAKELNTYRKVFGYLVGQFDCLKDKYERLISNLEANCFSHGKRGDINTAMAIVNLKSNHKWTDRVENTLEGGEKPIQATINLGSGTKPD